MEKREITRLFVGGLLAIVAGLALVAVGGGPAYANDVLVTDGPDVVGVKSGAVGWLLIGVAVAGILVVLGGAACVLASWVAALVKTGQLPDKSWFVILLVTGLISLGLLGMVLYLAAGPEGQTPGEPTLPRMAGVGL